MPGAVTPSSFVTSMIGSSFGEVVWVAPIVILVASSGSFAAFTFVSCVVVQVPRPGFSLVEVCFGVSSSFFIPFFSFCHKFFS